MGRKNNSRRIRTGDPDNKLNAIRDEIEKGRRPATSDEKDGIPSNYREDEPSSAP